jgi:hypothetical protein
MSQERKRVEKAPIAKPTPKKREEPKLEEKPIEVIPEVVEKPKAKPKPVPKVEPKKREEVKVAEVKKPKLVVKTEIKESDLINPELAISETKRVRAKASDDKYVRYASSEYLKDKLTISEKIQKNEMKFAYFAIDGDEFYHYYILTK